MCAHLAARGALASVRGPPPVLAHPGNCSSPTSVTAAAMAAVCACARRAQGEPCVRCWLSRCESAKDRPLDGKQSASPLSAHVQAPGIADAGCRVYECGRGRAGAARFGSGEQRARAEVLSFVCSSCQQKRRAPPALARTQTVCCGTRARAAVGQVPINGLCARSKAHARHLDQQPSVCRAATA